MNPKETEIQKSICEYLSYRKVMFWRQNTNPIFADGKFHSMPKYSLRGVPDIIVIKDGQFWGLEVKRPKNKQSEHQIEFQKQCEAHGGKYFVVTCIEDVQAIGL